MSIVIVGAGPNLGAAVARRFGREGMPVGLISRDAAKLETLTDELATDGLPVAFRDEVSERGVHVAHTAIGGRIAPGADHEPDEVAEVPWQQHRDRSVFQTRIGIE
jgi:NAD(P)-dependent dehydrogenase (short-subunit alcohol dehydrogenase family)